MPGGRGIADPFPRTVGILAAADPDSRDSLALALEDRLRLALPRQVAVAVYGPVPGDAQDDLAPGIRRAVSPADLAARSQLVIAAVPDLETLQVMVAGPSGIQAGVHSPTVLVVATTCAPDALRSLAGRLHNTTAGLLTVVDAPLIGRPAEVRSGAARIMAGAPAAVFARAEPVLALLGPTTRVGGIGSAQVAAACSQLVLASTAVTLIETAILAERAGLDVAQLLASWRTTGALGQVLTDVADLMAGRTGATFPTTSWAGPLDVARGEARKSQTRSTVLATVDELHARAIVSGDPTESLLHRVRLVLEERHEVADRGDALREPTGG